MMRRQKFTFEHCEPRCLLTVNFEYHALADIETLGDVRTVDLDGDHDLDIVVGSESGVVFHQNLNRFQNFTSHRIGDGPISNVEPIDMDGDHDLDLYVRFVNGRFAWYEQGEPGRFSDTALSTFPFEAFGDIDGDGDIDAISLVELTFAWHKTEGKEVGVGLRQPVDIATTPEDPIHRELAYEVELVDLDEDGDLDIFSYPRDRPGILYWHDNQDGLGSFAGRQPFDAFPGPGFITAMLADIDGDGDTDVAAATLEAGMWWMANEGQGKFLPSVQLADAFSGEGFHDLDDDGLPDLVQLHNFDLPWPKLYVIWQQAKGTGISFAAPPTVIDPSPFTRSIFVEDLDQDGDLDILATSPDEIGWFESDVVDRNRLTADANGDEAVDMADFLVLSQNFGSANADRTMGDFDGDGAVTFADFLILANNFGARDESV